jgi:hypothetical protein
LNQKARTSFSEEKEPGRRCGKKTSSIWAMGDGIFDAHGTDSIKVFALLFSKSGFLLLRPTHIRL